MCIDIVQIWFGIANGQIKSIFDRVICPPQESGGIFSFHIFIYVNCLPDDFLLYRYPSLYTCPWLQSIHLCIAAEYRYTPVYCCRVPVYTCVLLQSTGIHLCMAAEYWYTPVYGCRVPVYTCVWLQSTGIHLCMAAEDLLTFVMQNKLSCNAHF